MPKKEGTDRVRPDWRETTERFISWKPNDSTDENVIKDDDKNNMNFVDDIKGIGPRVWKSIEDRYSRPFVATPGKPGTRASPLLRGRRF